MNRLLLFLFLLIGSLLASAGVALAQPTNAPAQRATPAEARATTLRRARQLELERRYESAWQLLGQLDPANLDPAVAMQKASLALNYYTATAGLSRFAFRDLKLTDLPPDSLRQIGQDSLRYRFAVRSVLDRLQRQHPNNYRLARALGDYYYTVQQCGCAEQDTGEDEVFLRTITEYEQAHAHGQGDYLSYFALGYAYQRLGRFRQSLPPFERSLELRYNNPTTHLNLAFVLLELRDLEKARYHARSAQHLFPDAHHKEDAGFLMQQIEERIRQTSSAKAAPQDPAPAPDAAPEPATAPAPDAPAPAEEPEMATVPENPVVQPRSPREEKRETRKKERRKE
ncbi:hypothetical protein CDA63_04415 [Hymenobacter amundsenii]|uniref:Uncharacterized protein n=1 Tax=Hymenobacter amundsenii TaxID=2006685 RepID=A0A246FNI0_9BACT|nr:hypothetical protein [Hymenobacter amundsenii]OWP64288.1 hypothetical protein CDA63_04415 [Hymenobacter amundsenii]